MPLINRIIDYKPLERVTSDSGYRYYVDPDGHKCPSVTTILSATANKPELEAWRKRVGLIEANRIMTEATGLGSLLHQHLENYIRGEDRPRGNNVVRQLAKNMADQIINRGLINVSEIWGIEEALYYPVLYAGTADLIGIHQGEPAILDYKTTKIMKKKDIISDYFIQMAAYAIAHDAVYNTTINKGVIFMVDRNLEFYEFVVEGKEFQSWRNKWLERLELFQNLSTNL
jgi:CRISPR/Cas system-associated exonuclease Cas4 (RecB family)